MLNIIQRYMNNLKIEDVDAFAKRKNIILSEEELAFTYDFVKKNYKDVLNSHGIFEINRYEGKYSPENFAKIKKVYTEYLSKYQSFL